MICSDPLLTYLKSFGYNVVRLPKTDIKPLQILLQQGNLLTGHELNRLGDLATLLVTGRQIGLPPIQENAQAANISGQRTSDLGVGVGLSILGTIIGSMGGSKLGLDVKYQQAKSVAFEIQDVLADSVNVVELDQYLADAD